MSGDGVTNVAASVRQQLKNKAAEQGIVFDQVLVDYGIERFLFRLAQTKWRDRLIVKGATMLRAWGTPLGRPTRDIDFLGRLDNSPEAVADAVRECLAVEYPDGLAFEQAVTTSEITVADRYPGVRAVVRATLDGAQIKLTLDIGIDDAAIPEPEWVDYPSLLDFDAPHVLIYHPATAVAEKFQTMVDLAATNTRVKDYHDIYTMSESHEFRGEDLTEAFRATFAKRGTALPTETPPALLSDYYDDEDRVRQWDAFRNKPGVEAPESLEQVCLSASAFIMPAAAAAAGERKILGTWIPGKGWSHHDDEDDEEGLG